MTKHIVIVGANGHGKVVADIASRMGYEKIEFLDDNEAIKECGGFAVIGKTNKELDKKIDIFVAIGDAEIRKKFYQKFESIGCNIPVLVHPQAVLARDVQIGAGSIVMAGVVINPGAKIGKGCIINTCSSVDHDCQIGDYAHVSVGAHLAGNVCVGEQVWIGAGATVSNNKSIISNCMIGAGAVVVKNIKMPGTYIGVPAKIIEG